MSRARRIWRVAALSVVKHDYLPRAVAAHPRFEVAVVADDVDRPPWTHERNTLFARELGIPYVRDVERALRDFDVDVAVVSSEAERHCDLGIRAVEAGLHVILDKPMSPSLEECERMLRTVRAHGVKSLVWNRNFLPALLNARDIVRGGALGDLFAVHCDFYFSKDAGPPKGSRLEKPIDWLERQLEAHADGSDGGVGVAPLGELQVEGIYPLAYIRMLTSARVRRVFARTAAHFHQANVDNEVEDLATVTLEMEGGLTGSLCIGRIGAASHPDIGDIKLHLLGREGGLVVAEARPEVAVYYRGQDPKEFRHRRIADDNDFLLMEDFARALDGDGSTVLDVEGARDICAVIDAAVRSSRSGRPEDVSAAPPVHRA